MRKLNQNDLIAVNGGFMIGPISFIEGYLFGHALDWIWDNRQEIINWYNAPQTKDAVNKGASPNCRWPSPNRPACGA